MRAAANLMTPSGPPMPRLASAALDSRVVARTTAAIPTEIPTEDFDMAPAPRQASSYSSERDGEPKVPGSGRCRAEANPKTKELQWQIVVLLHRNLDLFVPQHRQRPGDPLSRRVRH